MSQLPVCKRSRHWQTISAAAAHRQLSLQQCHQCQQVQYPPRENCRRCLSDELSWQAIDAVGVVNSWTIIHASSKPYFREHGPWPVVNLTVSAAVVMYAHASTACLQTGKTVKVHSVLDKNNVATFIATSTGGGLEEYEKISELI